MTCPVEALLLGDSLAMCRLRDLIRRVAPSALPVLIEGPTGSGKELVARALHAASGRRGAFVAFNVCAIPDTMFEDTLFGHVRGAFTGAVHDSAGYLAQAHDGTAFFDEISGLPLGAQAKLLRAVETREFRPVGGRRDCRSEFRLIAATNVNVEELQRRGLFREDLLHRFGKLVLRLPPLSERPDDVPLLARHFLAQCASDREFTPAALERLRVLDWPGNVRELRSVVEAAGVLAPKRWINATDLSGLVSEGSRQEIQLEFELRRTLQVLRETGGDVKAASALLGVNRTTIYRRLRRAGVSSALLTSEAAVTISRSSGVV